MAAPPQLNLKCPFCADLFLAPAQEGMTSSVNEETGDQVVSLQVVYSAFHTCAEAPVIVP